MSHPYRVRPKPLPVIAPNPQVGEFMVIGNLTIPRVEGPVVRRTQFKAFWRTAHGDVGVFLEYVRFSGDEATARTLCERLKSSEALREEDMRRADQRHQKRVQAWIARAYSNTLNPKDHERAEETNEDPA